MRPGAPPDAGDTEVIYDYEAFLRGFFYLTPPIQRDDTTRSRWMDSLTDLADHARVFSVRLCVEHFPGRMLGTATETIRFIDQIDHEALFLLLDVGHCLISSEDPAQTVLNARHRLGYVHFNDNDGTEDLHWPVLTGRLTESQVRQDGAVASFR